MIARRAAVVVLLIGCGARPPEQESPREEERAGQSVAKETPPPDAAIDAAPDAAPLLPAITPVVEQTNGVPGLEVSCWLDHGISWTVKIWNSGRDELVVNWKGSTLLLPDDRPTGSLITNSGETEELVEPGETIYSVVTPEMLAPLAKDPLVLDFVHQGHFALDVWQPTMNTEWRGSISSSGPVGDSTRAAAAKIATKAPIAGKPTKQPRRAPSEPADTTRPAVRHRPSTTYSPSYSSPVCKRGCPCGNSCISCSKRCRK